MSRTVNFKSLQPRIGMYDREEKRIRQLHGPRNDMKYQIKLNDKILDKNKGKKTSPGRVKHGTNFGEKEVPVPDNQKIRNKDLFGTQKMIKVGPQDYDPPIIGTNTLQVKYRDPVATKTERGTVKRRMDEYLDTVLEKGGDFVQKAKEEEVLTATAMG